MHGSARSAWNANFISGLPTRAHPVGGLESFPASPGSGPAGVWKPPCSDPTGGRIASAAGRFRLSPEAIMAYPTVLVQTQRHQGVLHHARGGLQDIRQDVQDIRRTRSCAGAPKLGFRGYRLGRDKRSSVGAPRPIGARSSIWQPLLPAARQIPPPLPP